MNILILFFAFRYIYIISKIEKIRKKEKRRRIKFLLINIYIKKINFNQSLFTKIYNLCWRKSLCWIQLKNTNQYLL